MALPAIDASRVVAWQYGALGETLVDADSWIRQLGLRPHPEGGYYAECYRSPEMISARCVPARFKGPRRLATAIFFLLEGDDFSAFHRLKADEIWHFYAGGCLALYVLDERGRLATHLLGCDPARSQTPQVVVPWGRWMAARTLERDSYALVGCTMAPGFEFADFELGRRSELLAQYPHHEALIVSLTRQAS